MKTKKWTKKEDYYLFMNITKEDNKEKAFKKSSKKYNRSPEAAKQRWYKHLNNEYSKDYIGDKSRQINNHVEDTFETITKLSKKKMSIKDMFAYLFEPYLNPNKLKSHNK